MQRGARLIDLANEELERSKEPGDPDRQLNLRRQAAEKAWVHVTSHADRLLGVHARDETAHQERWARLVALDDPALILTYSEIQRELHGDCFYNGSCPLQRVEMLIRAAEGFPERLERVLRRRRRA